MCTFRFTGRLAAFFVIGSFIVALPVHIHAQDPVGTWKLLIRDGNTPDAQAPNPMNTQSWTYMSENHLNTATGQVYWCLKVIERKCKASNPVVAGGTEIGRFAWVEFMAKDDHTASGHTNDTFFVDTKTKDIYHCKPLLKDHGYPAQFLCDKY